jgi:uncharacterized protein involved in exopolysaccharide biosynthesis
LYERESQNSYFFIISNIDQIYREHNEKLSIRLLNSRSNSIEIIYKSNNSRQAADVTNTIASEFQAFDVEKKKESVKNILDFIETQLKMFTKPWTILRINYKSLKRKITYLHETFREISISDFYK